VSWTIGHGGNLVSAAVSPLRERAQAKDVVRGDDVHERLACRLTEPAPESGLVIVWKAEDEGVLEPEYRAQLGRQAGIQVAAWEPDLDAHHAALAGRLKEPGDTETADAEAIGDVHLRGALEIVLPGDPCREDDLRGAVDRQSRHVAPHSWFSQLLLI
jgi:hypothetical protein